MFFKSKTSPNFNERRDGATPNLLILHYTGMKTADEALERLCDPAAEVSAHYVVEENGKIHQLVEEDRRAWHAGVSCWRGVRDVNSHSIGIEIVNPGYEFGYVSFPDRQISAVLKLCREIVKRWTICADHVLGHSDVAPARKLDPGHLFPWAKFAQEGVGLWPSPVEMDYQAAEDLILNQDSVHELLIGYGYDPQAEYNDVLRAFMRHYHPERFAAWDDQPEPDVATFARLLALVRAGHEL